MTKTGNFDAFFREKYLTKNMFLSANGTTGVYNLTLFLLPYYAVQPQFGSYISYQLGSLVLDAFSTRTILYAVLTVCMLPLAKLGFKKHQVL